MDLQLKKALNDNLTDYVFGYPFGIEKINNRDYVVFREFGKRRIYLREDSFTSKEQAKAYLSPIVEKYSNSIITAITQEENN
jgi:hypothetical protein